jgi:hypothetical protein
MKSSFVILILFLLLNIGCRVQYDTFVLSNSTNHHLVIEGYRTGGNGISSASSDLILMDPYSTLYFKRTAGEDEDGRTFFSIRYVDSVTIVFDSAIILSLSCPTYPYVESCHPILQEPLTVAITEEDYNNAVPVEE